MTKILTISLPAEPADFRECCLTEARARQVPGVVSACVQGGTLRLGLKPSASAARVRLGVSAILGLGLVSRGARALGDTASQLARLPEGAGNEIAEELREHKKGALLSLGGLIAFEVIKRVSPTLFASTTLLRSAWVIMMSLGLFKSGLLGAIRERRPNADTLTVTAVMASVLASRPESSLTLLALSHFSEALTVMAAQRARSNISDLMSLDVREVWVRGEDGVERRVPIEQVGTGMLVEFHAGEKIVVDG
ncbi:MAG: cation-transporting P-type ATPase, partial [Succinivibrionaceae bacterium]|nr:cation-transporting P-type ATPase [Succinivibrionaceae bacterium]